jgi:hypothetical protein
VDRGQRHRFGFLAFALASALGALLLLIPSVAVAQTSYPLPPGGPVATGGIAVVPGGGGTGIAPLAPTTTTSQPQVKGKQATRPNSKGAGGGTSGLSGIWIAIIAALILALLGWFFFFLFGRRGGEGDQPA